MIYLVNGQCVVRCQKKSFPTCHSMKSRFCTALTCAAMQTSGKSPYPLYSVLLQCKETFSYFCSLSQMCKFNHSCIFYFRHEKTKHPNEHIPSHTESVSFSEKKTEEEDFLRNYHVARLRFGLLDLFVRDSIQGDGARILLCLPYLLLLFHHYKRTKYSYVILLHLVKVYALLPESLAHELVYCRFWNTKGGAGNNIPLDLRMEHMVRLFKLSLKQLGANIESKGAQRIAQSLSHVEEMMHNIDYDGSIVKRSGYHSTKHLRETVTQTVSDLFEIGAFKEEKGRKHPSFPKFSKNVVDKMNFTEYYSWMARLLKLWEAVYKA